MEGEEEKQPISKGRIDLGIVGKAQIMTKLKAGERCN